MVDSRDKKILDCLKRTGECSSKEIHDNVDISVSYATIKRILTKLINENFLLSVGQGRGTKYINSCDVINSKKSVFEKALSFKEIFINQFEFAVDTYF